jgi:hypothetical protein
VEVPLAGFPAIMQGLLTFAVGGVALYVIVNPKMKPELQKWAIGIIGTLIGFWLRG